MGIYENACDQQLKKDKNSFGFSRTTKPKTRKYLMKVVELRASTSIDKYLGLLFVVGWSKINAFKGIVDRVKKRLKNWKYKFLSSARKEILIKSILQSIPTYSMSVFFLRLWLFALRCIHSFQSFGGVHKINFLKFKS